MFVPHGSLRLYVETRGKGPDMVLLHGHPSCHEMWLPVATPLADRYRVTVIDLRGHGRSDLGADIEVSVAAMADDLEQVCKAVGINRAVFAGVSLGGYVLFAFLRQHRARVRGLFLSGTRAGADTPAVRTKRFETATAVQTAGVAQFLDAALPKLLSPYTIRSRPDLAEAVRHTMRFSVPESVAAIQNAMAGREDLTRLLATIHFPVALFFGADDAVVPFAEATELCRRFPNAALHCEPQAGHFAVFEKPEAAQSMFRRYLYALP